MHHYILIRKFYFCSVAAVLLASALLSISCIGTTPTDNREVELSHKEAELAKKEAELLKKELETTKSEIANRNSNVGEPKLDRQKSKPPARVQPVAPQAECDSGHWIQSVSSDGSIIKLEDGSIWKVDSVDTVISSIWLPVTDVVVCDDKIINTDDNESVGVSRLR